MLQPATMQELEMPTDIALNPTITRSQLYDLVWSHETKILANLFGISGSLVGRVCRRWLIPKPGRGEWQQMQAGQTIARPPLAPSPSKEADPIVLEEGAQGRYATRVPRKERAPRPKRDPMAAYFEMQRIQQERGRREKEIEAAELEALTSGPATRHVLAIEGWRTAYDIRAAAFGRLIFEDECTVQIDCRYLLPERRRGAALQLELVCRLQRAEDDRGNPLEQDLGVLRGRKKQAYLSVARDKTPYLCAALASGHIRRIDLEVVGGRRIRRAELCSRLWDEAENLVSA